jgi:hypothetical protein
MRLARRLKIQAFWNEHKSVRLHLHTRNIHAYRHRLRCRAAYSNQISLPIRNVTRRAGTFATQLHEYMSAPSVVDPTLACVCICGPLYTPDHSPIFRYLPPNVR